MTPLKTPSSNTKNKANFFLPNRDENGIAPVWETLYGQKTTQQEKTLQVDSFDSGEMNSKFDIYDTNSQSRLFSLGDFSSLSTSSDRITAAGEPLTNWNALKN